MTSTAASPSGGVMQPPQPPPQPQPPSLPTSGSAAPAFQALPAARAVQQHWTHINQRIHDSLIVPYSEQEARDDYFTFLALVDTLESEVDRLGLTHVAYPAELLNAFTSSSGNTCFIHVQGAAAGAALDPSLITRLPTDLADMIPTLKSENQVLSQIVRVVSQQSKELVKTIESVRDARKKEEEHQQMAATGMGEGEHSGIEASVYVAQHQQQRPAPFAMGQQQQHHQQQQSTWQQQQQHHQQQPPHSQHQPPLHPSQRRTPQHPSI